MGFRKTTQASKKLILSALSIKALRMSLTIVVFALTPVDGLHPYKKKKFILLISSDLAKPR